MRQRNVGCVVYITEAERVPVCFDILTLAAVWNTRLKMHCNLRQHRLVQGFSRRSRPDRIALTCVYGYVRRKSSSRICSQPREPPDGEE